MRALSAIDIALWDLAGKAANAPVYQLLGGASRASIRTYNTCYDHIDFIKEPVRLAKELLASGIHAMKIWPFDPIAVHTRGQYITPEQIRQGAEPLRLIREELGDSMQVAMEFHGSWNCSVRRYESPSAGALCTTVVRGDAAAGQSRFLSRIEPRHATASLHQRAADDALEFPRNTGESCGEGDYAGDLLVWGDLRSKKDSLSGGDLLSPVSTAQLRRSDSAFCFGASGRQSN